MKQSLLPALHYVRIDEQLRRFVRSIFRYIYYLAYSIISSLFSFTFFLSTFETLNNFCKYLNFFETFHQCQGDKLRLILLTITRLLLLYNVHMLCYEKGKFVAMVIIVKALKIRALFDVTSVTVN